MNQQELNEKLNQNKNFHLTLKVIQFVDDDLLNDFADYLTSFHCTYVKIKNINEAYEILLQAYQNQIQYVLCNDCIDCLLPLVCIVSQDNFTIVKPIIPVYYLLKDNRIIQKLKTLCRKRMTTFTAFKNKKELFQQVLNLIKN